MSKLHFDNDDCQVWLCTDACEGSESKHASHDGIVVGIGSERDEALASAETELQIVLSELRDSIDHEASQEHDEFEDDESEESI